MIPTADRTKATVQVKVTILDKDKDLQAGDEREGHVPGAGKKREPTEPAAVAARPSSASPARAAVVHARRRKPVGVRESVGGQARRQRGVVAGAERKDRCVVKEGLPAGRRRLVVRPPETLQGRGRGAGR